MLTIMACMSEPKPKGEVRVERVCLYSNKMKKFPEELILFSHTLTALDLSNNDLASLPPALLASLTSLQYLNLKFNKLQAVTSDIAFLSNLE